MSDGSKANPCSGWLANEEGWSRLWIFKAKKKRNKQKTPQNTNQANTTTISFQQLNLRGESINAEDGEYFGDPMKTKDIDTI